MANSARYFYSAWYCTPCLEYKLFTKNNYIQNFSGYWDFARIDIFFWLFAALAFFIFLKIKPIQHKASDKIQKS